MKSKITKIQILKKGILTMLMLALVLPNVIYAAETLGDSSALDVMLYGTVGSTANEIAEYFNAGNTTLSISNESELRALAEYVNAGNTCAGKTIIMSNSIAVSSEAWVPIGTTGNPFNGTFDGNYNTISGITYTSSSGTNGYYFGIFGATAANAIIKNVRTENFNISVSGMVTGGIVGNNFGTISNCINTASITGNQKIGGIAGYNSRNHTKLYK